MSSDEHTPAGQDDWKEALRAAEQDPDNADKALEALEQLDEHAEPEQARRFAEALQSRFAANADVQAVLGQYYDSEDQAEQAEACFRRALELDPEHRDARRAVADIHLENEEPEKAMELLDFMTESPEEADPLLLGQAARQFQDAGRHDKALSVFEALLAAEPRLGHDKDFRRVVRASERAVEREESILPTRPLVKRRWFQLTVVAAVLVVAAVVANAVIAGSRTLHVVNGLDVPVTVRIDGGDPVTVAARQREEITVGEGRHEAVCALPDGANQTHEFTVSSDVGQRFFGDQVFVLNPFGAAVLVWSKVPFSQEGDQPGGENRIHAGQAFHTFADIDYPFQQLPNRIRTSSREGVVFKTNLRVQPVPPQVLLMLGEELPWSPEDQLSFLEWHLRASPDDAQLMSVYVNHAVQHQALPRCRDFLADKLGDRPVRAEWHRYYQEAMQLLGRGGQLVAKYDALLADDPDNPDLLYLRGRVAASHPEALRYFGQALAADPDHLHALRAKAIHLVSDGDFAQARPLAEKATELRPEDPQAQELLTTVRLALKEHEALAEELQAAFRQNPTGRTDAFERLLEVLAAAGRPAEAEQAKTQGLQLLHQQEAPIPEQVDWWANLECAYVTGRLERIRALAERYRPFETAERYLAMAQLAQGNLDQIPAGYADGQLAGSEATWHLLMYLAHHGRGESTKAQARLGQAIEALREGADPASNWAPALTKVPDATPADLDRYYFARPAQKAVALVTLARLCPERRTAFLEEAERFNFRRRFPYWFLRRAIDQLRSGPATAPGTPPTTQPATRPSTQPATQPATAPTP